MEPDDTMDLECRITTSHCFSLRPPFGHAGALDIGPPEIELRVKGWLR
jgi:hypothetical protein